MLLRPTKQGLRASLLSSIGGRSPPFETTGVCTRRQPACCDELFADPNVDCTGHWQGHRLWSAEGTGGATYNLYGYSPPLDTALAPAML